MMKVDPSVTVKRGVIFHDTMVGQTYYNRYGELVFIYFNTTTGHKGAAYLVSGNVYVPIHGELLTPAKVKVVSDEN